MRESRSRLNDLYRHFNLLDLISFININNIIRNKNIREYIKKEIQVRFTQYTKKKERNILVL